MFARTLFPTLLAGAALASCTDRMSPNNDRFGATGELIALSGGEGGARYACVTCHGVRGEGNGYDAPRLAGLPEGYLQKQMEDYAADLRPHEVMREVASFLDSDERVKVAAYYAAMTPAAAPPATAGSASAGAQALYRQGDARRELASCASCHGQMGQGANQGPPISGQPAFYTAKQLRDWQAAKRRNDGDHAMLIVAQKLTEPEIRDLSLYLARLPPALPPRAR